MNVLSFLAWKARESSLNRSRQMNRELDMTFAFDRIPGINSSDSKAQDLNMTSGGCYRREGKTDIRTSQLKRERDKESMDGKK